MCTIAVMAYICLVEECQSRTARYVEGGIQSRVPLSLFYITLSSHIDSPDLDWKRNRVISPFRIMALSLPIRLRPERPKRKSRRWMETKKVNILIGHAPKFRRDVIKSGLERPRERTSRMVSSDIVPYKSGV